MMKSVFPQSMVFRCPSCGREHGFRSHWQPWCPECLSALEPWTSLACPRCGRSQAVEGLCGTCQVSPPPQKVTLHRFRYEGIIRDIVHAYKFSFWFFLGLPLAMSLMGPLHDMGPDFEDAPLVPVPTHPLRRLNRRFDPVGYVTRWLSRISGRRCLPLLSKGRSTPPQSLLSRSERMGQPASLYRCRGGRMPSRAVMVDDVYTTGSTASACLRAMIRDGIPDVALLTLCRTP